MTPRDSEPSLRTRAARTGHQDGDGDVWPVVHPIVTSTALAGRDPDAIHRRIGRDEPTYHRAHFPNAVRLEEAVAELEGAEAGYATSSGMAAVTTVVLALLGQGDHLIVGTGGYSDSEELLTRELVRFGIDGSVVPLDDLDAVRDAIRPRTRLIFAETIANPSMMVPDLEQLARIARGRDIRLVVDNTVPTPMLCRPLEHGADLVIHSVTKFIGGHHDLSAGMVVGSRDLIDRLARVGYLLGAVPGAHDAALALRGIHTLAPRMAWISESADCIARYLAEQPEVACVRYPGLATGVEGERVRRMLPNGCSGLMVIEFNGTATQAPAAAFVRSLKLIPYVTSLGGEITTVCYPPRILADGDPETARVGTRLRLSVGLEDPEDLIADLKGAFEAMR
ncbi:MAG: aminotransferase class I/II-fold pyridoxal phosphate-dependent enzyme [Chloroflexota bacterium]|nr:aminotransferase class I/II-fold pyridoxal phosphate-dependent enzyme [Chloroflexota bacterium]